MNNKIEIIKANKTPQEFYNIVNDTCPICGNKLNTLHSIVKLGNIGFDTNCYLESTGSEIKIK